MAEPIVAILDWRGAAALKENRRFLNRAGEDDRVGPRGWRKNASRFRSLTLRADGSCELRELSAAAAARRAGTVMVRGTSRKTGNGERG